MKTFFLFFICAFSSLCAGAVTMFNDSAFQLRAVVMGADGTYLGEVVLNPQHSNTWTDDYGRTGSGFKNSTKSQTPYTVMWYCLDGNVFAVCNGASTGATVTASSCDGPKLCKPRKKGGSFPDSSKNPESSFLQPSEETTQSPSE